MNASSIKKSLAVLAAVAAVSVSTSARADEAPCVFSVLDACYAGKVTGPSFSDITAGDLSLSSISDLTGIFFGVRAKISDVSLWTAGGTLVATDSSMADGVTFDDVSIGEYVVKLSGKVLNHKKPGLYFGGFAVTSAVTSAVPEPESYALMGAGLLAVLFLSRRRNNG